jgi:hypothetical protein
MQSIASGASNIAMTGISSGGFGGGNKSLSSQFKKNDTSIRNMLKNPPNVEEYIAPIV